MLILDLLKYTGLSKSKFYAFPITPSFLSRIKLGVMTLLGRVSWLPRLKVPSDLILPKELLYSLSRHVAMAER